MIFQLILSEWEDTDKHPESEKNMTKVIEIEMA